MVEAFPPFSVVRRAHRTRPAAMEAPTQPGGEPASGGNLTRLLDAARGGNREAFDEAFAIVYRELRRLARGCLRSNRRDTLPPTALVHEAYVKLVRHAVPDWQGRTHFFSVAATAMRQILIDQARRRRTAKRGADQAPAPLDDDPAARTPDLDELLALDEALERLGALDPRLRAVVEYRYYCGLQEHEIATLLGVSARTVERDWRRARAWLHTSIQTGRDARQGSHDAPVDSDR
jgi:RNA polymerase sigma factor (TIGR02999 family)